MRKMSSKLIALVLSLLVAFGSIVSGTIAWFTDEVTSKNNIIKSGTLKVKLSASEDGANWQEVANNSAPLFNYGLWEPGYTTYKFLKIENVGSLAFKYALNIKPDKAVTGDYKLADVIDVYTGTDVPTRSNLGTLKGTLTSLMDNVNGAFSGMLEAGQATSFCLTLKMQESADNNYQNLSIGDGFSLQLIATQATVEMDGFGDNQYDKDAHWVNLDWYLANPNAEEFTLNSLEDLAGFAQIVNGTAVNPNDSSAALLHDDFKGQTIKLGKDIDLKGIDWTPVGRIGKTSTDFTYAFKGTFDGNGKTVSNLEVFNEGWAGLFGLAHSATIKNVTVENATIYSNRMAGAVVGQIYGSIENCHVEGAEIVVVPNAVNGSYDNGDKVGGIVGWIGDNGNNRILSGCSAMDVKLSAYRDVGGIVGYVASSTSVINNSAANIEITVDQATHYYGSKDFNAGMIMGRVNGTITTDNNQTSGDNNSIKSTYAKDGLTFKQDGLTGDVTLYLVPETYTSEKVTVPAGVTTIGNYAFAYNSNVKTVELAESVRELGRAFDSSTVEKVVLNEGLEKISSRAFRATSALKEVVIPSTVKVIEDDAFQKTGIKTITIPATVEKVGTTAFGSSEVETVIFEGTITIENKAFRGCTKLRTVYLNGADVVFANTVNQGGCWFCNSESNNPNTSNITFYVKNTTVAQKVKTAMGAEANNIPVYVDGVLFE